MQFTSTNHRQNKTVLGRIRMLGDFFRRMSCRLIQDRNLPRNSIAEIETLDISNKNTSIRPQEHMKNC
jgi:hypothetical protein